VLKRAVVLNLVKAALTVWCLMPALSLLYVLNRMDRHFIRNFNYQVFALAIGETGAWAFIFLFITLACTPIQRLTGWRFAGELRRTLGLIAFLYSFLHLVAYFVIGQKLRLDYTWADAMLRKSRFRVGRRCSCWCRSPSPPRTAWFAAWAPNVGRICTASCTSRARSPSGTWPGPMPTIRPTITARRTRSCRS